MTQIAHQPNQSLQDIFSLQQLQLITDYLATHPQGLIQLFLMNMLHPGGNYIALVHQLITIREIIISGRSMPYESHQGAFYGIPQSKELVRETGIVIFIPASGAPDLIGIVRRRQDDSKNPAVYWVQTFLMSPRGHLGQLQIQPATAFSHPDVFMRGYAGVLDCLTFGTSLADCRDLFELDRYRKLEEFLRFFGV